MPGDGGGSTQMLPLWVQWLFAIGGIGLIVAVFLALWSRLGKIEKRIGRLEERSKKFATEGEQEDPASA